MPAFKPACLALAFLVSLSPAAHAASSTADGRISVLQLNEMLEKAGSDPLAAQVLTAYLAGIGETAAGMLEVAGAEAQRSCSEPMQMSAETARLAIRASAGNRTRWGETPATPILLRDMLERARCALNS